MKRMSEKTINEFKEKLTSEKGRIKASVILKESQEIEMEGDDLDKVQGKILADIDARFSGRDRFKLLQIENALKKIENGSFGICDACDESIGKKRLLAKPDANLCIACAERAESVNAHFN